MQILSLCVGHVFPWVVVHALKGLTLIPRPAGHRHLVISSSLINIATFAEASFPLPAITQPPWH